MDLLSQISRFVGGHEQSNHDPNILSKFLHDRLLEISNENKHTNNVIESGKNGQTTVEHHKYESTVISSDNQGTVTRNIVYHERMT